jgi:hypothetical protein
MAIERISFLPLADKSREFLFLLLASVTALLAGPEIDRVATGIGYIDWYAECVGTEPARSNTGIGQTPSSWLEDF